MQQIYNTSSLHFLNRIWNSKRADICNVSYCKLFVPGGKYFEIYLVTNCCDNRKINKIWFLAPKSMLRQQKVLFVRMHVKIHPVYSILSYNIAPQYSPQYLCTNKCFFSKNTFSFALMCSHLFSTEFMRQHLQTQRQACKHIFQINIEIIIKQ